MAKEDKSGLSITTLAISAAAAVAAAVIVPMFWERGTLIATAMTPVIVALVSEGLKRPVEKVSAVAPRTVRRTPASAPAPVTEPFEPLPVPEREAAPRQRSDDPFGLRAPQRRGPSARHWKLALATGVAAFAIAVVAVTTSELVFGGPATADGGRTTFFSSRDRDRDREATPTPTATPSATETPAPTATPEATPAPTETPAPTATPAPTTQAAPQATPAPTATPPPAP